MGWIFSHRKDLWVVANYDKKIIEEYRPRELNEKEKWIELAKRANADWQMQID